MTTIINLPDTDTIMAGLTAFDDTPHVVEQLYPRIASHGGTQKTPEGVAVLLALAVSDYTRGLPPLMTHMMLLNLPAYVGVLTGSDEAAKAAVLAVLRATGHASS